MKKFKNLEQRNRLIANKLLDTVYLLKILERLLEGEGEEYTILKYINKNVKTVFNKIEYCRKMISMT